MAWKWVSPGDLPDYWEASAAFAAAAGLPASQWPPAGWAPPHEPPPDGTPHEPQPPGEAPAQPQPWQPTAPQPATPPWARPARGPPSEAGSRWSTTAAPEGADQPSESAAAPATGPSDSGSITGRSARWPRPARGVTQHAQPDWTRAQSQYAPGEAPWHARQPALDTGGDHSTQPNEDEDGPPHTRPTPDSYNRQPRRGFFGGDDSLYGPLSSDVPRPSHPVREQGYWGRPKRQRPDPSESSQWPAWDDAQPEGARQRSASWTSTAARAPPPEQYTRPSPAMREAAARAAAAREPAARPRGPRPQPRAPADQCAHQSSPAESSRVTPGRLAMVPPHQWHLQQARPKSSSQAPQAKKEARPTKPRPPRRPSSMEPPPTSAAQAPPPHAQPRRQGVPLAAPTAQAEPEATPAESSAPTQGRPTRRAKRRRSRAAAAQQTPTEEPQAAPTGDPSQGLAAATGEEAGASSPPPPHPGTEGQGAGETEVKPAASSRAVYTSGRRATQPSTLGGASYRACSQGTEARTSTRP